MGLVVGLECNGAYQGTKEAGHCPMGWPARFCCLGAGHDQVEDKTPKTLDLGAAHVRLITASLP